MYQGTLWLDYEASGDGCNYKATVSKCVASPDSVILDFHGKEGGHAFSGSCRLTLVAGSQFSGPGHFLHKGAPDPEAVVSVDVDLADRKLFLTGTWHNRGDAKPFRLNAELERVAPLNTETAESSQ